MADFEKVQYVRQCCFSILPQLYCDRFSITEQIGKIVNALNKLIENNNKLEDYVKEIIREVIESGEIEEIIKDMLANYILNVKFPPEGIEPASGDGSKDDTLAIQGCIDYAYNAGGKAVYFPSGSYLTNSLDLKNNVTLCGFSNENTKLVLKGGATRPILNGNINNTGIYNLKIDGNSDIQVNNLNLIDLTVENITLNNLFLTDGYTLLNLNVSNTAIISNIIFDKSVVNGAVLMGIGSVSGNNLIFNQMSPLSPNSVITLDTSNSNLTLISKVTIPTPIKIHGNNNKIIANIVNGIEPLIEDTGTKNNIEITGKILKNNFDKVEIISNNYNETIIEKNSNLGTINENVSGEKNVTSGSYIEITGNKTTNATNITENIENKKTVITKEFEVQSEDFIIKSINPITYKKPNILDENFNSIKFKDIDGELYDVLVYNGKKLNNGLFKSVIEYGAIGNGIHDDTSAIQECINENKYILIPEGTYKITSEIYLHSSCYITGGGTLKPTKDVEHCLTLLAPTGTKYKNLTIYDIELIGEYSLTNTPSCGIYVQRGQNIFIKNVKVSNFNQGIRISESDYVEIDNIVGSNFQRTENRINGYGILTQACTNYSISNCVLQADRHCIYLYDYKNVYVTNCKLSNKNGISNLTGYEMALKCGGGEFATIENIIFDTCYGGIEIAGDEPDSKGSLNVNINNCIFKNELPVTSKAFAWIWTIETYSNDITISNCYIYSTTGRSIAIEGGVKHYIDNCKIYNNGSALGAIRISNETGTANINNCYFEDFNNILDLPESNNLITFNSNIISGNGTIANFYNWKTFKANNNFNNGNYDYTDILLNTFNVDGWKFGTLGVGIELTNLTGGLVGDTFYVNCTNSGAKILDTGNILIKEPVIAEENLVILLLKSQVNKWVEIGRYS